MSKSAKRKHIATKRHVELREPQQEELEAIEHDWLAEMVGEEDAAYFEMAGIDDIGNK